MRRVISAFENNPILAAVKEEAQLPAALASECGVIFLLCGTACSVPRLVDQVHRAGRVAYVHLDLVQGLSPREAAADFLMQEALADGIISTKPQLLRYAGSIGLGTVLRVFLVDSLSLGNLPKMTETCTPDLVEILPGILPRVIRRVAASVPVPLITGGLVETRADVLAALDAGALCVSTSSPALWREL